MLKGVVCVVLGRREGRRGRGIGGRVRGFVGGGALEGRRSFNDNKSLDAYIVYYCSYLFEFLQGVAQ